MIKYTITPYICKLKTDGELREYNLQIDVELITNHYDIIEYFKRLRYLNNLDCLMGVEITFLNTDTLFQSFRYITKKKLNKSIEHINKLFQIV